MLQTTRKPLCLLFTLLVFTICCAGVRADLKLPSVFADHMVLQREASVPIWGWADAGSDVTVEFHGQSATVQAGPDGKWMARLEPMAAGGPYELSIKAGGKTQTFSDVLVGDVWLCSGQSNMDMRIRKVMNAEAEIAAADHPNLRLFRVERAMSADPQPDVAAHWAVCTPQSVRDFSAAAYFLGRDLQKELDVPVGLLHCAYGGTSAEAWTSMPALEADGRLTSIIIGQRAKEARYKMDLAAYQKAVEAGDEHTVKPASIMDRHNPAVLFNAMVHPLIPYAIRGAVWYQGESNVFHSMQYEPLLTALVNDWRTRWDQPDLPFGVVQLPNYVTPPRVPRGDYSWPEMRDSQLRVSQNMPNVGLIVTIDIGNPTNIHPTNKQEVGRRLALWALHDVYGRDVIASGPVFRKAVFEGDKVRLSFDAVGAGLMTREGGPIKGFIIAGADRKFRWAEAEIAGNEIIVSEAKVKKPEAVRYAWDENPYWANLVNADGLPASPFRTDDWPGITDNN